eukprot:PhM_4_TR18753/c0_g1_i1/m.17307/K17496/TIM50; mitochondrial import inner membrane translocase subunit TIM50
MGCCESSPHINNNSSLNGSMVRSVRSASRGQFTVSASADGGSSSSEENRNPCRGSPLSAPELPSSSCNFNNTNSEEGNHHIDDDTYESGTDQEFTNLGGRDDNNIFLDDGGLTASMPSHPALFPGLDELTQPMASLLWDPDKPVLLPQKKLEHATRPTFVLGLEQLLVRSVPAMDVTESTKVYSRAFLEEFFEFCADNCELVIWTSALRSHAQYVLRTVDPGHTVSYCIYRHSKWFPFGPQHSHEQAQPHGSIVAPSSFEHCKDLSLLDRDPSTVLFITANEKLARENCASTILVPEMRLDSDDWLLPTLARAVRSLVTDHKRSMGRPPNVIQFLKTSPLITFNQATGCFCLHPERAAHAWLRDGLDTDLIVQNELFLKSVTTSRGSNTTAATTSTSSAGYLVSSIE